MCDTKPLGTLNDKHWFDKTQRLQSPVVESVIDQDAIDELADSEKCRYQIVTDNFILKRNWAIDGHRQWRCDRFCCGSNDLKQERNTTMQFSVIYSADCPADEDIDDFASPNVSDLWDETEDDDNYEYGYLEGEWENDHHRKWCAFLSRDQFTEFVEHCNLFAEDAETMGSLGDPRFGYGWAPAISFNSDDPNAIQNAYATPLPETQRDSCDEQDWDRVRGAVLSVYGSFPDKARSISWSGSLGTPAI